MERFSLDQPPSFLRRSRWPHILARLVDYSLFYFLGIVVSIFLFLYEERSFYLIFACLVPLLWIPLEMVLLKIFGTTLGKALLKIKLSKDERKAISWKSAFRFARSFGKIPEGKFQLQAGLGRKILGLLVCLACVVGVFYSPQFSGKVFGRYSTTTVVGWVNFISAEGGFKVAFPTEPVMEPKILEAPDSGRVFNYNEYLSHHPYNNEESYAVSYIDLPKRWSMVSSRTILKGVLNVIIDSDSSIELIDKKLSYHNNMPSMEFRFKQAGRELKGKLVLSGSRLYKLSVMHSTEAAETAQHQQFLDSFDLYTNKI